MPRLSDQLRCLALGGLCRLPPDIGRMERLTKLILHDTVGHGFGLPATFTLLARLQVGARACHAALVHAGSMLGAWKHAAARSAARLAATWMRRDFSTPAGAVHPEQLLCVKQVGGGGE